MLNEKCKKSSEYKVVLLGQSEVGKTSLVDRFVNKRFRGTHFATIGGAYNRLLKDDIPLGIWDTAGQERYYSLIKFYHRNSDIILLVYNVNDDDSIQRLNIYLQKLQDLNGEYRIIFVGNKLDLVENKGYIKNQCKKKLEKILENYKDELSKKPLYYYISVKENDGVDKLLNDIFLECKGLPIKIEKNIRVDKSINIISKIYNGISLGCSC